MSIYDLRMRLLDVPGGQNLVMRYDNSENQQHFAIGDVSVIMPPDATDDEIISALKSALGID